MGGRRKPLHLVCYGYINEYDPAKYPRTGNCLQSARCQSITKEQVRKNINEYLRRYAFPKEESQKRKDLRVAYRK